MQGHRTAAFGRRKVDKVGHSVCKTKKAVEIGAACAEAVVGRDVAASIRQRRPARPGPTRTTDRSEVPPPMSTISTSSSFGVVCS